MSSVVDLAAALLGMIPRNVAPTVYDGQAPTSGSEVPAPPWTVASLALPDPLARSNAATLTASEARVRLTATAGTATGVRMILDDLLALEGQRPVAEGWVCGPLLLVNVREPQVDRDLTFPGAAGHPVYGVVEFAATVSTP